MTEDFAPRRLPRPFDAERGREVAQRLGALPDGLDDLIAGAAGCSPYLAGLIEKEADWLVESLAAPEAALEAELRRAEVWDDAHLPSRLRQGKQRVALLTGLADLGGIWPLERVTGSLSAFAQAATTSALRAAIAPAIRRGKVPGQGEADIAAAGGMCVLAMGKLGAEELNYSSDIDLICLFDETRFVPDQYHDARSAFVRATRAMCATLSEITAEGYVFRTDLRLRPDPAVTPVCLAMEAAERYYESLGRTWERAAFIKARPIAGDLAAGERFLAALTPFVWRKHLDFAAIQDAHDMRLAIRAHKGGGGPITLPGHNVKLGRGGIREIEFFTQTRQLIAGGRDRSLRRRGTREGLDVLARQGWITAQIAEDLSDHYVFLRTVEHRLQMVQDAQTHSLPQTEEGFDRLAAMMGRERCDLKDEIRRRLEAVHGSTEGFFAPSPSPSSAGESADTALDPQVLGRWPSYPALRSQRSQSIFARIKPELMRRLAEAGKPDAALLAFDGFLSRLPAGVQLFSMLEANPSLLDLLVDIVSTSPALAQHLSQNAGVLDAVIGGDFFTDWPGEEGLQAGLAREVARAVDYEAMLDSARRWSKEWHFRIGVHLLRGLTGPDEAAGQYSDLARATLVVLWPVVTAMFAEKHGPPPGRGAVILGMGSLGAGWLNATSDLDLIVIYDAPGIEQSTGEKPLSTRVYYARLTQALITALSAPMSEGKLYEVDMRLRPSGNQGPVATSFDAFRSYQREQAWLWEHLALLRAAPVAGPEALASDIDDFRRDLLSTPRRLVDVAREVADMRERLKSAKTPGSVWEAKTGPGRLQDIDLMAQAGALAMGRPVAATREGLQAAQESGLIDGETCAMLTETAQRLAAINVVVRLLTPGVLRNDDLTPGSRAFLARALGMERIDAVEEDLTETYARCADAIDRALAAHLPEEPS